MLIILGYSRKMHTPQRMATIFDPVTISGEYCREYTERNEKRASQHVLKMADNKKTLYSKARS